MQKSGSSSPSSQTFMHNNNHGNNTNITNPPRVKIFSPHKKLKIPSQTLRAYIYARRSNPSHKMSFLEPTPCKNPLVYDELNRLVFEYLSINGLDQTLQSFVDECAQKNLPCPTTTGKNNNTNNKPTFSQDEAERMLKAFDTGKREAFFELWDLFQSHIRVTSFEEMGKLEVFIQVYFAVWPRSHNYSESLQEEAMAQLKNFFETNNKKLSKYKDATILPLYALPFVEDPHKHAIFKELFRDIWIIKLRAQLESTVGKYFDLLQQNICQHSRLAELIVKGGRYEAGNFEYKKGSDGDFQDRFYQLLGNHKRLRTVVQTQREAFARLLAVSQEFLFSVEETNQEPWDLLEKCYGICPELFVPSGSTEAPYTFDYFKEFTPTPLILNQPDRDEDSCEVSLYILGIASPDTLDFAKIKSSLINSSDPNLQVSSSEKLCLLQALRWLITKTTEHCRQKVLDTFISHDLFGVSASADDYREKLFDCLSSSGPSSYQKEALSRLLNAICSTRDGRAYMSTNEYVVKILVKALPGLEKSEEAYICQMVLATLQKLSLKKTIRLYMIEKKVIAWLSSYIKREVENSFNPYLMEYAWALLMNLCLHEEAWSTCVQNGVDLLESACKMFMLAQNKEVLPYVVSTLYSLLRSPGMFALAKNIQMENLIAPLLTKQSTLSEHLSSLVSLLYTPGCDRITTTRETNYDDEDSPDADAFEPEIELLETWTLSLTDADPVGDDLLLRKYFLEKKSKQRKEEKLRIPAATTLFTTPEITRPITPSSHRIVEIKKPPRGPSTSSRKPSTHTLKPSKTSDSVRFIVPPPEFEGGKKAKSKMQYHCLKK